MGDEEMLKEAPVAREISSFGNEKYRELSKLATEELRKKSKGVTSPKRVSEILKVKVG